MPVFDVVHLSFLVNEDGVVGFPLPWDLLYPSANFEY